MPRQYRATRDTKDSEYLRRIGDNIRAARNRKGYSQEEFADIAGFCRSYFTEIETGKRNISVLNLIKILKALDVNIDKLIRVIKK